jgi:hypothetical protein
MVLHAHLCGQRLVSAINSRAYDGNSPAEFTERPLCLETNDPLLHLNHLCRRLPKLRSLMAFTTGLGCGLWKEMLLSSLLKTTAEPCPCAAFIPLSISARTKSI